jgi:hypothetical protein
MVLQISKQVSLSALLALKCYPHLWVTLLPSTREFIAIPHLGTILKSPGRVFFAAKPETQGASFPPGYHYA